MDGRVARLLGATSVFGAQLDSLSDFVCFGVAPPLVLYIWQLHDIKGIGWALVLFFSVCTALRLARFNTALFEEQEPWEKQFFIGIPSPAGGILCLLPLVISLQFGESLPPAFTACNMLLVGMLMPSRIPTFSGKKMHISPEAILPLMLVCGACPLSSTPLNHNVNQYVQSIIAKRLLRSSAPAGTPGIARVFNAAFGIRKLRLRAGLAAAARIQRKPAGRPRRHAIVADFPCHGPQRP
jgi:CDP-diacylglycerol--serine O-phosphatidyltransferase